VRYRRLTDPASAVLLHISIHQPVPSPHRWPPNEKGRGHSRRPVPNVIELNNMTPNMTLLGAGNDPEPN
jgi:hypothetical protein